MTYNCVTDWDVVTSIFMNRHLWLLQPPLCSLTPRLMILSLGVGSCSGATNFRSRHGVEEEGNWIRGASLMLVEKLAIVSFFIDCDMSSMLSYLSGKLH